MSGFTGHFVPKIYSRSASAALQTTQLSLLFSNCWVEPGELNDYRMPWSSPKDGDEQQGPGLFRTTEIETSKRSQGNKGLCSSHVLVGSRIIWPRIISGGPLPPSGSDQHLTVWINPNLYQGEDTPNAILCSTRACRAASAVKLIL